MLRKKFISLLDLSSKFSQEFKDKFLNNFDKSTNVQKIQLIADLESLLIGAGFLKESDPLKNLYDSIK